MKKVALVFISAVFIPSLILAVLAIRSLRHQQLVMEGQQNLLYREVIQSLFKDLDQKVAEKHREFTALAHKLTSGRDPRDAAGTFDKQLRTAWPLATVGFVASLNGEVLTPSPFAGADARRFRIENDALLCSKETVEVYWNSPKGAVNLSQLERSERDYSGKAVFATKGGPEVYSVKAGEFPERAGPSGAPLSSAPEETEFRNLVGDSFGGSLARFTQDRLTLLFWTRHERDPDFVFGAQVNVPELARELGQLLEVEDRLKDQIAVALLDDRGSVLTASRSGLDWREPYLTVELGEALPHWKLALALLQPGRISESVKTIRLTLGLLIAALLLAIATGSWLIVRDLQKQLALARQKTDFVSNVSHELKTPLTSIRMFSELLQSPTVEKQKQREFLQIIHNEAARLTRLINNVLDFSRMERQDRSYNLQRFDLVENLRRLLDDYRPQLEAKGFKLAAEFPDASVLVDADADAIVQALMNLLSNAEKYGGESKEILVHLQERDGEVRVSICDRGPGVPAGMEEKIFEQFVRAHDSLSSGIPGSGLGLTLARQIARAHGGDVHYSPRPGGGSCFELRLPT